MDYYGTSPPDCRGNYLPNINYYMNDGYLNQPPFINQLEPINAYTGQVTMAPTSAGVQQKRRLSDVTNENGEEELSNKKSKPLNPFAPECSIPLPYQLGDEFG